MGQVVSYMGEESPVPRGQRAQRLSCLKNGAEAGLAGEVGRGWALIGDEVRDVRARSGYTDFGSACCGESPADFGQSQCAGHSFESRWTGGRARAARHSGGSCTSPGDTAWWLGPVC